jgi:SAM-dependent methyltransferase
VTVVNVEMAKHWDGAEGDDWTDNADRYDATGRFFEPHLEKVLAAATTDEVLDVGCGTGLTTREAARQASAGHAVGIDLSSRMIEEARRRAAADALTNVEFVRGDAQVHPFDARRFDLAMSLFGTIFFADREAGFANIARAMRAGARLVLVGWQPLPANEWLVVFREALAAGRELPTPPVGSPGPFGHADPDGVAAALRRAGFDDVDVAPIHERMWLGEDATDAWSFVSTFGIVRGLTEGLDPDARDASLGRLRAVLEQNDGPDGVTLGCAAWLYTARRRG